jgi:hypothetical protein
MRTLTFNVGAASTNLSTAVNALSVGQWAAFTSSSFPTYGGPPTFSSPGAYLFFREPGDPGEAANILDYSQIGYRDATRGKIFHIGAAYNGRCFFCVYDEATDAWSRYTINADITHSWDQLSYDSARGLLYIFSPSAQASWSYNVDTRVLTALTNGPHTNSAETVNARYFPAADKTVTYRGADGGIRALAGGATTWTTLGTDPNAFLGRGGLSSYDHVNGELYVCGGITLTTTLRKINSAGTVTQLSSSGPPAFTATSLMLPDPQTGLPVVFMYGSAVQAWTGSSWSSISTFPSALGSSRLFGVSLTGFSGRSVFMFINGSNVVYLYRRS